MGPVRAQRCPVRLHALRSHTGAWFSIPSSARQARSCEMSLLVWSGISSVAMMLTTAQKAM
jgi:hypothetical protein